MGKYALLLVLALLWLAGSASAQSPGPSVHISRDSAEYGPRAEHAKAFRELTTYGSTATSYFRFQHTFADHERDGLVEGAIVGGIAGSVFGAVYFRGWSAFGSESPGAKETIVGIVLGGALGASLGMLVDAML